MREPCVHCGQRFRHGERYGCCAKCGVAFVGQTAFDAHLRFEGGDVEHLDPATVRRKDGSARLEQRTIKGGKAWAEIPRDN